MYKCITSISENSEAVKLKFLNKVIAANEIYTHNGVFHADETFAIAMVDLVKFIKSWKILRTRDHQILENVKNKQIILDVGEIYCPEMGIIDHHQIEFDRHYTILNEYGDYAKIPMATCGCVWELLGEQIIRNVIPNTPLDTPDIEGVEYVRIGMRNFLFQIDAVDVGQLAVLGLTKAQTMAGVISMFNHEDVNDDESQLACFKDAVKLARMIIIKKIINLVKKYNSKSIILKALKESQENDHEKYLIVDQIGVPWRDTISDYWDYFENTRLIIFKSGENDYRVQTLPLYREDFTSQRCPAPKELCGKSMEELIKLTNIPEITFLHRAGFLGGTKSLESAIKLAQYWIEESPLI